MAVWEVYAHPVKFKYKSTVCSKSAFFAACTTLLSFLLPLLVAYRSHGFWLKNSFFREQPTVRFKHDYLLHIETDRPDQPILCSNLPYTTEYDRCTVIKSREEDINRDGKYDALIMEIEVETSPNGVYSVEVVLVFEYLLQKRCLLKMESLGVIHFTSGIPGCQLDYTGDLRLVQKALLSTRGRNHQYNGSIFDLSSDKRSALNLNRILRDYGKRTVSTRLENCYQVWTPGSHLDEPFKINIHINYPEENIMYRPSFWEVIKWAWIQYFSLLFVFLNLFQRVKGYVFGNHLVPTMKEIPWKKIQ